MASITKRPGGFYTVLIYLKKGRNQAKIHLPTRNRREAERIAAYIQDLADSIKTGTRNPEADQWAARLGDEGVELYEKLEKLGLVKPRAKRRTLSELIELFVQNNGGKPATLYRYRSVWELLVGLLGDVPVDKVTVEDAARFEAMYRSEPLDRRKKTPKPYSRATFNRGIVRIKTVFRFAEKMEWIRNSPFRFASGGESVNKERWHYVPVEVFMKILEKCQNPKWRLILALGRFCGIRGASEVHKMIWADVDFKKKMLVLRAGKKEGKKDELRSVPMNSVVMAAFQKWKPEAATPSDRVFPSLAEGTNFSIMTAKYIRWAGLDPWPEPWYNFRRSFCSDIMEAGVDPKIYEAVCGHSFQMGMSHYQILHPDRQSKGYDRIRIALEPPEG